MITDRVMHPYRRCTYCAVNVQSEDLRRSLSVAGVAHSQALARARSDGTGERSGAGNGSAEGAETQGQCSRASIPEELQVLGAERCARCIAIRKRYVTD